MGLIGTRIEWTVDPANANSNDGSLVRDGRRLRRRFAVKRQGVVWSAGPVRGTAWVQPDVREQGEGPAVCVTIRRNGEHVATPADQRRSTQELQDTTLHSLRICWPLPPEMVPAAGDDSDPRPLHPSRLRRGALGVPA